MDESQKKTRLRSRKFTRDICFNITLFLKCIYTPLHTFPYLFSGQEERGKCIRDFRRDNPEKNRQ